MVKSFGKTADFKVFEKKNIMIILSMIAKYVDKYNA